ncbi:uncharacterized protein LOC103314139 isoform X1 [Tribolium castaneum]|uniref:Uncharacterized protein n=1 Tax=Tribolium castaneum TaxID=7070 RepID=D6WUV3_TRICA|nr:hypothetical protein TcasGA2_TC006783 [Tribolium castaneum]
MLSLEKLANANIKNRAEYTQLSTELNRLEKEKKNELRMFNNEIQRFKSKYSKSNFSTDSPEASNVKMYETHNPGFCYKRNGEHRVLQVSENTPPVDFERLHFLLFTNGEVDIEKILCLHLLSSHETDHLTPPRRPRTSGGFMKKDSPVEQLIERSKENPREAVLRAILPTYILDVNKGHTKRTLLDERLSARLIVNEKILELIMTVITALENSNPEKVQHLISLAEDPSSLKRIFRKQHIQDFVMTLKNHSLVNSCSSFILTQPNKVTPSHIAIRTPTGALEDLVRYIRANVLQFPKRSSFNLIEPESRELLTIERSKMSTKVSNLSTKPITITMPKPEFRKESKDEASRFRRKSTNFIKKNIESIPNYKRGSEDENFTNKPKKIRRASTDSSRRTVPNSRKSSTTSDRSMLDSPLKKHEHKNDEIKVHLKQTTCPACMEKWKIPLPSPKVPRYKRPSSGSTSSEVPQPIIKTDSMRRISNMIEKEQFVLSSYDRRYSNVSSGSNQSRRKSSVQSGSLDLVALNILDLEKIRHEIREKETQKKLEKFLGA